MPRYLAQREPSASPGSHESPEGVTLSRQWNRSLFPLSCQLLLDSVGQVSLRGGGCCDLEVGVSPMDMDG